MQSIILECDIGNTRCKWRWLAGDGHVVERGSFAHGKGSIKLPPATLLDRIRIASVASEDIVQQIMAPINGCGIEPEFAISTPMAAGVRNAYAGESHRLGVDRWLAVIAAYHQQRGAALVIDAGSALTADLVTAGGEHLGGYILPGRRLMQEALLADTGQVKFAAQTNVEGLAFGCTTADAVHAGILASQVGAVFVAIAEANRRISSDFAILLTGGDATRIVDHMPPEVIKAPDLVLDGLARVLP